MSWGFETDAAFQEELDWVRDFVENEIEPLALILDNPYDVRDPRRNALIRPLQQITRERKLWATHLGPELGGAGYGQVKLALMNEILGRAPLHAPIIFGCQAPDSGNAEILAHYGTEEQKDRFLKPLLENEIVSCYAMTEPQGGSDPKVFRTSAVRQGDCWVLNGEKWFASHARWASFLIVLAVTDVDAAPYQRMSMFIVPIDLPGVEIVRNVGYVTEPLPAHGYLRFTDVRIPLDHLLGERGKGFVVAQTPLGGGRIHHAMRTIGEATKALDLMCRRAASRETQGERLSKKQLVQEKIAESWIELQQFRLLVLQTAWKIDKYQDYKKVRGDISAVKAQMPKVLNQIASRALQIHGSLGLSTETPFASMVLNSFHMGLADGPTEVHLLALAREILRDYIPSNELFPSYNLIDQKSRALEKYAAPS